MTNAPILLFTYKRLEPLKQTILALQKNVIASESELFIFSDGAKSEKDEEQVNQVRAYLKTITGFKNKKLKEAPTNKGLANSIIAGVTEVLENHDKVIVLEDDLIVSPNFLEYMNAALSFYEDNKNIASVCGYTTPIKNTNNYDVYFTKRSSSWGWGTWRDKWSNVDWEVEDYQKFLKDKKCQQEFNKMGSDLTGMLKQQMEGKINSWAVRWTYFQYTHNLFSVHPIISKVTNEGFGVNATHTSGVNKSRFATVLDTSTNKEYNFPSEPFLDHEIIRQFVDRYSIKTRIYYKLRKLLRV
ncbi:glycosyltransferase [Botryobacter ruber]|uniref:glycosyltransferase n=1 Tax=Botryobacter ruber TaxID=2171629 RepID=UPI000E0B3DDC|nr:glycosyltransferase [Botryobacter ruber]